MDGSRQFLLPHRQTQLKTKDFDGRNARNLEVVVVVVEVIVTKEGT